MELTPDDKEFWDCKEQFYEVLHQLAEEFYELQLTKFTRQTAQNYFLVADAWADFIYGYTECINYNQISVAETNSKFWSQERHQGLYDFDSKEVKSKLKVFVEFLRERGYENPYVDKALAKK